MRLSLYIAIALLCLPMVSLADDTPVAPAPLQGRSIFHESDNTVKGVVSDIDTVNRIITINTPDGGVAYLYGDDTVFQSGLRFVELERVTTGSRVAGLFADGRPPRLTRLMLMTGDLTYHRYKKKRTSLRSRERSHGGSRSVESPRQNSKHSVSKSRKSRKAGHGKAKAKGKAKGKARGKTNQSRK